MTDEIKAQMRDVQESLVFFSKASMENRKQKNGQIMPFAVG